MKNLFKSMFLVIAMMAISLVSFAQPGDPGCDPDLPPQASGNFTAVSPGNINANTVQTLVIDYTGGLGMIETDLTVKIFFLLNGMPEALITVGTISNVGAGCEDDDDSFSINYGFSHIWKGYTYVVLVEAPGHTVTPSGQYSIN